MNIFEAGQIGGGLAGLSVGIVGSSHDLVPTLLLGALGLGVGAVGGFLFAIVLLCLLVLVQMAWRAARRLPPFAEPPGDSAWRTTRRAAKRGTFLSAAACGFALMVSGWPTGVAVAMAAVLVTAVVAVALGEVSRAESDDG